MLVLNRIHHVYSILQMVLGTWLSQLSTQAASVHRNIWSYYTKLLKYLSSNSPRWSRSLTPRKPIIATPGITLGTKSRYQNPPHPRTLLNFSTTYSLIMSPLPFFCIRELCVSTCDISTVPAIGKFEMCWIRTLVILYGTESHMQIYLTRITNLIVGCFKGSIS